MLITLIISVDNGSIYTTIISLILQLFIYCITYFFKITWWTWNSCKINVSNLIYVCSPVGKKVKDSDKPAVLKLAKPPNLVSSGNWSPPVFFLFPLKHHLSRSIRRQLLKLASLIKKKPFWSKRFHRIDHFN